CARHNTAIHAETPTLHMDQGDEELARITKNARDTLPVFFAHLLRPQNGEGNFRVKYPFRADQNSGFNMEQLWLCDIRFKDGVFYGDIANTPFYTGSLQKGDTVSFSAADITDWMYTTNGKIVGGASIQYLLEQLPEHSAAQQRIMEMFAD
ncbi:MAG: DUF2314 domain-containing protein, partial [Treponema sp.]|nr:DUF2314 domain-containing protein [Treponema sp.]